MTGYGGDRLLIRFQLLQQQQQQKRDNSMCICKGVPEKLVADASYTFVPFEFIIHL